MAEFTVQQALGLAREHHSAGRLREAEQLYRQVLTRRPDHLDALIRLGVIAHQAGDYEMALELIRRTLAVYPNSSDAHNNLGNTLREMGRLDEAIAAYQKALALKADFPEAHNNLGNALRDNAQLHEAVAAYRQAIRLRPSYHKARFNLSLALLALGDFDAGWEEFESRWKCRDFVSPRRNLPQPHWDGSPLAGRALLIHAEQGFGDAIQFSRYLPLVLQRNADQGGKIIFESPPELHSLFKTLPQMTARTCQIIPRGEPLPSFDLICPLLSLPRIFKTTSASIPSQVPYLAPDPMLVEFWRQKFDASASGLKVGLAWAGNPAHRNDSSRSLSLDCLSPLAQVPGVQFYSLQKNPTASRAKPAPPALNLIDWTDQLGDFSDTAALVDHLDLIITADTAVAHLGGALARPTWVLLSFAPDWRWMQQRDDSPWYPSMRLFRQPASGDWDSVIKRVTAALSDQMK
jgi:hypothetical protein